MDLPLVREDEDNICLPLVVSVVARYWHEPIPLEEAKSIAKRYQGIKASIMIEGIELAERHNFKTYIYHGSINDLKRRIDQGLPPIVILPGIRDIVQHAVVVQGYDDKRILTYVPKPNNIGAIDENRFELLWREDDNITLLIVPDDMSMYVKEEMRSLQSNRVSFEVERLRIYAKYNEAIELLSRFTGERNARIHYMLGVLYSDINRYDDARQCYNEAIAINDRFYLAYRALGNLYLKLKDYRKADEYYTKAIEINPMRFAPIYKNRAIARLEMNAKDDAIKDLRAYLAYNPDAYDKVSIEINIKELSV